MKSLQKELLFFFFLERLALEKFLGRVEKMKWYVRC